MKGIEFIVDNRGKKTAALINLKEFGKIWEDIEDVLVAFQRGKAPRVTLEEVKANLKKKGKL